MKKVFLFSLSFLLFLVTQSQLIVNTGSLTPTQYVQNVLAGSGVSISNVTFTGQSSQIGEFNSVNANVGIDSGLVLSTGDVTLLIGPNNTGSQTTDYSSASSDPDLAAITSIVNFDAAILEFDFIPQGDTIEFKYVFGSEEYLEFVNAGFNDGFGLFLSGPGIAGPYTNAAENIALVPGTTTPVTIDNVNNITNPAYYVDNGDGFSTPYSSDPQYIQFDGKTVVLTAKHAVQCNQTYHLKIAICDAGDGAYDSGIFLEAGSLTSNGVLVNIVTATGDSTLIEGCGNAILNFYRPDTAGDYTVHFDIGGNAQNGTDYTPIPDSVTFLSGYDTTSLTLSAIADMIPEGTEVITFTVYSVTSCGDTIITTANLYIIDEADITTNLSDTSFICPPDSLILDASASGGIPPYSYSWNNGQTSAQITIYPTQTDTFIVAITDSCNLKTFYDTVIVNLGSYSPLIVTPMPDTTIRCPLSSNDSIMIYANVQGGAQPVTISWSNGSSNDSTYVFPSAVNNYFFITATDVCGNSISDTVKITREIYTPLNISISATDSLCIINNGNAVANITGGVPPYTYNWSFDGQPYSGNPIIFNSQSNGNNSLDVTVTDYCNISDNMSRDVFVYSCSVSVPNVFTPNSDGLNDFFIIENIDFYENNHVVIFNRWGQKVFETNNYQNNWNGSNVNDGTYYYIIELNDADNTILKGSITILKHKK